jgi:hypothetical protein
MKTLNLTAWISGGIAGILIVLAVLALIFKTSFFGTVHVVNYFHMANSFLLVAICCLLFQREMKKS